MTLSLIVLVIVVVVCLTLLFGHDALALVIGIVTYVMLMYDKVLKSK